MMDKKLTGQTAIVTGGSSGIGAGVAKALGEAGANVVVNYYKGEDEAQQIVDHIEQSGAKATAVQADVSSETDVERMFAECLNAFGALDILIANSGIQKDAPFVDLTLDDWNRVIDVNLTGQFLCLRAAARQFLKQGVRDGVSRAAGKIICMSSVHEAIPWAGHVNYAASKGGVMLMMQSVAQELGPKKIRVNSIAPGAIRTPINEDARDTPEERESLLELIPYNRIGEPADIAKAAVWLASDDADYVHGTSLVIDGGMMLYPSFAHGG